MSQVQKQGCLVLRKMTNYEQRESEPNNSCTATSQLTLLKDQIKNPSHQAQLVPAYSASTFWKKIPVPAQANGENHTDSHYAIKICDPGKYCCPYVIQSQKNLSHLSFLIFQHFFIKSSYGSLCTGYIPAYRAFYFQFILQPSFCFKNFKGASQALVVVLYERWAASEKLKKYKFITRLVNNVTMLSCNSFPTCFAAYKEITDYNLLNHKENENFVLVFRL